MPTGGVLDAGIVAARSSALGRAGALDQSCLNASDHPLVPIGDKPLEGRATKARAMEEEVEEEGAESFGRTKLLRSEEGRAESDDGVPTAEELSAVSDEGNEEPACNIGDSYQACVPDWEGPKETNDVDTTPDRPDALLWSNSHIRYRAARHDKELAVARGSVLPHPEEGKEGCP